MSTNPRTSQHTSRRPDSEPAVKPIEITPELKALMRRLKQANSWTPCPTGSRWPEPTGCPTTTSWK